MHPLCSLKCLSGDGSLRWVTVDLLVTAESLTVNYSGLGFNPVLIPLIFWRKYWSGVVHGCYQPQAEGVFYLHSHLVQRFLHQWPWLQPFSLKTNTGHKCNNHREEEVGQILLMSRLYLLADLGSWAAVRDINFLPLSTCFSFALPESLLWWCCSTLLYHCGTTRKYMYGSNNPQTILEQWSISVSRGSVSC